MDSGVEETASDFRHLDLSAEPVVGTNRNENNSESDRDANSCDENKGNPVRSGRHGNKESLLGGVQEYNARTSVLTSSPARHYADPVLVNVAGQIDDTSCATSRVSNTRETMPNVLVETSAATPASFNYPLYLRQHSASPAAINRSVYDAMRTNDAILLRQILSDVGVAYILRHCMIIPSDDKPPGESATSAAAGADTGTVEEGSDDAAVVYKRDESDLQGDSARSEVVPDAAVDTTIRTSESMADEAEATKPDAAEDANNEERDDESNNEVENTEQHHRATEKGRTLFLVAAFYGADRAIGVLADACLQYFTTQRGQSSAEQTLHRLLTLPTRSGSVPLLVAAYRNHGRVVETLLLKYHVDAYTCNQNGSSAAIIAASRNAVDALRALALDSETDFNAADKQGITPFLAACIHSSVEALQYLYEYRKGDEAVVDMSICDNSGFGCAALAARYNKPDVLRYISSLHRHDDSGLVPNLNERVISPDEDDPVGFHLDPPIHIATKFNSIEAVDALLKSPDCDVTARNVQGRTALHVAVERNHVDVVRCYANLSPEGFELLDTEDATGMTPLYLACHLGLKEIVEILAPISDAQVVCIVEDDEVPVHQQAAENTEKSENAEGGDVVEDKQPAPLPAVIRTKRQPPLLAAVIHNHVDCVSSLLSFGVDVNQTDDRGHSGLSIGAKHGYLRMCEILLSNGADPSIRSLKGGGTPLQKARKYKHAQVVELLERHEFLQRSQNEDIIS